MADWDLGLPPSGLWTAHQAGAGGATRRSRWRSTRTASQVLSGSSSLFDQGDRSGANVGGDDAVEVGKDVNHVGAVLAGAHDPIDFIGCGIVAASDFGTLGGEPEFPADEFQAVWATQSTEVDDWRRFLIDQVD